MGWEPDKPSRNEDEYFAKRDAEWLRERRAQLDAERAARAAQPKLKCPRCGGEMHERDFRDVKIDVCAKCHGVWFDAGELEMVLHMPRAELMGLIKAVESGG